MSFIAKMARQVGRQGGADSANEEALDIISFIESPYGLKFSKELVGQSLFPVQRFILKMFYNLPLEKEKKVISIPKGWRYAQDPNGMLHFTEQEYLEHLYKEGRCNIKEQDHMRSEMILAIGRRSGKCVPLCHTHLYTSQGMLTLEELAPKGKLKDDTWYPLDNKPTIALEGKELRSTSDQFYYKGKAPTFKIKSHCGYNIECTAEHRVKVMTEAGTLEWKYGNEIKEGDQLAIHRNVKLWPEKHYPVSQYQEFRGPEHFPDYLDEDWGLLLGILTGDGTWSNSSGVEVTNGCTEFTEFLEGLYTKMFGTYIKTQVKSANNTFRIRLKCRKTRNFLSELGWIHVPERDEKQIPWVIRRSPKSVVAAFLRGLFETDGSISGNSVTFSTASEKLANEVQLMLLNFGIISRIRVKKVKGYEQPYYELALFGIRSREIFAEEIGFLTSRKNDRLYSLTSSSSTPKSRAETIPHQKAWVTSLIESIPVSPQKGIQAQDRVWSRSHVRVAAGNTCKPSSTESMTYPRLVNLLEVARRHGAPEHLLQHGEQLLEWDYFYDEVISVTPSEAIVGDIQVPGHHMYVAQGMTNHNSAISAMVASYETYKLLKKYSPQKYYGTPDGAPIQICAVATSKDQAALLYKEVRRHFNNCEFFEQFKDSETQTQATFYTPRDQDTGNNPSVRITFYSAVAKGIRGSANIVAIMDEAAFFNNSGQASAHEVYQALSPSLAQFSPKDPTDASIPIGDSEGRMIMISSPYAKQGLFYEQYAQSLAGNEGSKGLLMIQAPTWEVNPTIPLDYFHKEYEKNPIQFLTEFGAQFTDKVKSWIERDEDMLAIINPDMRPVIRGRPRDPHYLGLDLAPKGDRTAVVLTRWQGEKIQKVYHEQWQAKTDWYELNPHLREPVITYPKSMTSEEILDYEKIADWLSELSKRFYIVKGVFDSYEGIGFGQVLDKKKVQNIEMENFTNTKTSEMFQAFQNYMFLEKLELYDYVLDDDDPSIGKRTGFSPHIQELMELEGVASGKRMIVVQAPQVRGKYDDYSDALVRSVWLAMNNEPKNRRSNSYYNGAPDVTNLGPRSVEQYRRSRERSNDLHGQRNVRNLVNPRNNRR